VNVKRRSCSCRPEYRARKSCLASKTGESVTAPAFASTTGVPSEKTAGTRMTAGVGSSSSAERGDVVRKVDGYGKMRKERVSEDPIDRPVIALLREVQRQRDDRPGNPANFGFSYLDVA